MLKKFNDFIKESYSSNLGFIKPREDFYLINESQESTSQHEAIKLVMNKFGWDKEKANNFVRVDLRNDITPLRDKQIGKFTLGVTRMYCDGELNDASTISNLNATLKLLTAHLGEYDRNLNGLHVDELISKFEKNRENNIKQEKQEISKMKFGESDYEIVKIESYNDAKKYYEYTNPNSRWCLTHMENMYESYTCGGINQIYFCLKNGFKNIKADVGKDAPLDEYGLSMLSIIVNENGELAFCTCRWNHANNGNDNMMDAVEISKVVNVDFYETFKPNTKWEDMINDAKQRLKNGENPRNIFKYVSRFENGFALVELNKRYNFINSDNEIISDKWFEDAESFDKCGFARIQLNNKHNFINGKGEYLSKDWFDYAEFVFNDGYCKVGLKTNKYKYNFINTKGEYLLKDWVDGASSFDEGFAIVKYSSNYKDRFNFINIDGEFLSDEYFDDVTHFKNGYAKVILDDKVNFIDKKGKIISDVWYDNVNSFNDGFAVVYTDLNGKYNFIDTKGKILSDKWFDDADDFNNEMAFVKLNKKYNYINVNGEFLFKDWLDVDGVYAFEGEFAKIRVNSKYNLINTNGEYLLKDWYDTIRPFYCERALVSNLKKGYNFINTDGKFISDVWFEDAQDFEYDFSRVVLDGKCNFINKDGKLLSKMWFNYNWDFQKNGLAKVEKDGVYNYINNKGEIISDIYFDAASQFRGGFAIVEKDDKYNLISVDGKLLSDKWFDYVEHFNKHGYSLVVLDDEYNYIDVDGKLIRDKWFKSKDELRNYCKDII